MTRLLRAAALFAALMLVTAPPALANRGQPERQVPFYSVSVGPSVDTTTPPPSTCPGAMWQFHSTGMADASHLGRVSMEVTHCSWSDSPTTGHFGPGTLVYTAANGDTLTLSQWGTFEVVWTPDSFTSYVTAEWVVIDGTGRFEGATGSGEASVVGDLIASTSSSTYWGTITYDASQAADR